MSIPAGTIPAARCTGCGHFAPVGEVVQCGICGCERHVAGPYGGHDPETPPGAEAALETFRDAMEPARDALRRAMDAEVIAELARDAARDELLLADDCLQAGVFDGVRVTVAQQNAWIGKRIRAEERDYRLAKSARKAAEKYLEVLGRQMSAQQSLTKSVAASYQGSRGEGRW